MGAALLCIKSGVTAEQREDHAQYLKRCIAVLKAVNRSIFWATSAAQKAADFLVSDLEGFFAVNQLRHVAGQLLGVGKATQELLFADVGLAAIVNHVVVEEFRAYSIRCGAMGQAFR